MSVARILSRAQEGLTAPLVDVEAHLGAGLPSFVIVGLPAPVVRESRERVRAALVNCGYEFPARRITVNLAPVELSKQGGRFDLPIALALLVASGQLRVRGRNGIECYGELGLAGELKPVSGLFLAAVHAASARHRLIVPQANAPEVQLSAHPSAYGAADLRAAARLLLEGRGEPLRLTPADVPGTAGARAGLADVVGQWQGKRALVVAAAGGHSLLFVGPPGSGKSMLAARLPLLLPKLSRAEALEVAGLTGLSGQLVDPRRWRERPFRSPHHTSSAAALIGGSSGRPGEISLAHHGVLFLDELPEFDRRVLEALREPLETGSISIARAARRLQLPARFQLVAAMNPCPCGYLGDAAETCRCTPARVQRYRERISGPLLDRIDMRIAVARLSPAELAQAAGVAAGIAGGRTAQSSDAPAPERSIALLPQGTGGPRLPDAAIDPVGQIEAARNRRLSRSGALCAHLSAGQLRACAALPAATARLLQLCCEQLAVSGRGVQRLLALGRTIADLADSDEIAPAHLAEAIQLRRGLVLERAPGTDGTSEVLARR